MKGRTYFLFTNNFCFYRGLSNTFFSKTSQLLLVKSNNAVSFYEFFTTRLQDGASHLIARNYWKLELARIEAPSKEEIRSVDGAEVDFYSNLKTKKIIRSAKLQSLEQTSLTSGLYISFAQWQ